MPIRLKLLCACLALLAGSALAQQGNAFAAAQGIFFRAMDGEDCADEAVSRFEKLAGGDSAQAPLYLAYLGAAQTLQGRDGWLPWQKLRATERGLDNIEKALRRLEAHHAQDNGATLALETRLVAASAYLAVPARFKRFDSGKQVLREAFADPGFASAAAEIRARLHRLAAQAAARDGKSGEEIEHLKMAVALAPGGKTAEDARQRLKELGS